MVNIQLDWKTLPLKIITIPIDRKSETETIQATDPMIKKEEKDTCRLFTYFCKTCKFFNNNLYIYIPTEKIFLINEFFIFLPI